MAPMFLPRVANSCPPPYTSCSPDTDTNTSFDPSFVENQGPRRFIGVAMVAGLVLIIFLVWLYRGRWPRKMLQQYCSCCRRSKKLLPEPEPTDDVTPRSPPIQTTSSEKNKSTPRDSALVEEVSAGMVVFTKVPKAFRAKEGHHPVEWEMDHVNGIRLEVLFLFGFLSLCAN